MGGWKGVAATVPYMLSSKWTLIFMSECLHAYRIAAQCRMRMSFGHCSESLLGSPFVPRKKALLSHQLVVIVLEWVKRPVANVQSLASWKWSTNCNHKHNKNQGKSWVKNIDHLDIFAFISGSFLRVASKLTSIPPESSQHCQVVKVMAENLWPILIWTWRG